MVIRTSGLVAAGLALAGCSSNYIPQSRGRVAVVMQNGTPAYVRDGQTYPHGFLGSGLVRAVAGNPNAEHAAHEYRDRIKTGLLAAVGGLVCSTVALGYAVREIDGNPESRNMPTALWVSLGCALGSLIGATYSITAEPYRWDAINIFNDQPPPVMFPAPGGWSSPPATLRMRDDATLASEASPHP